MDPFVIGAIVFVSGFGGGLGGTLARGFLPDHHLSKQTEDAMRLSMGLLATLSALVIGLLVARAQTSFGTRDSEIKQFSVDLILLDRELVHYGGAETDAARDALRRYTRFVIDATWPDEAAQPAHDGRGWALLEDVQDELRALAPATNAQRWLQNRALDVSGDLARMRWLLDVEVAPAIPLPFLVILIFWLTILFASFGLFAPFNATVTLAHAVCALSVAGALFLIVEMDRPFSGMIRISSVPMREALAQLER